MKIQLVTMRDLIENMYYRYDKFIDNEKIEKQAKAYHEALSGFDHSVVSLAAKWVDTEKFPNAQQLKTKCWELEKKQKIATPTDGKWHCANNEQSCKSWVINETQARISQNCFGKVVCYLCEQKLKAKQRPGDMEDLWLRQMYPKSFTGGDPEGFN